MNKLKNYISLNLISLSGLIFFIFCFIVFFILLPFARNYDIIHNNSEILAQYEHFKNINLLTLILKKDTSVLNSVIFFSGIIFTIIPFCFFIYQYVEYILTTHKLF